MEDNNWRIEGSNYIPPEVKDRVDRMFAQYKEQQQALIKRFEAEGVESIAITPFQLFVLKKLNPSNGNFEELSTNYQIVAEQLQEKGLAEGMGRLIVGVGNRVGWRRNMIGDIYLEWLESTGKEGTNASEKPAQEVGMLDDSGEPVCKPPAESVDEKPSGGGKKARRKRLSDTEISKGKELIRSYFEDKNSGGTLEKCFKKDCVVYLLARGLKGITENHLSSKSTLGEYYDEQWTSIQGRGKEVAGKSVTKKRQ